MSEDKVSFDECFKSLNSFLETVKQPAKTPPPQSLVSKSKPQPNPDVDNAKKNLKDMRKAHNELRASYQKKLFRNTIIKEIMKSSKSRDFKKPKKSAPNNPNLEEKTFDECLNELNQFLDNLKKGKQIDVVKTKTCLKSMKEIHESLSSHHNACKKKATCNMDIYPDVRARLFGFGPRRYKRSL